MKNETIPRFVLKRLAASFALSASVVAAQTLPPESERQLAREIYKEMVEIKSGYSTGATTPVAEAAARRLRAAGFPDADIFIGGAIPTKANLVVRYHGTGGRRPILLLAHTDVVEAKREDWSMDPFTLTERDGYFYGRGTGDDKAQAAVWIANLIRYKREGFRPDRDIIVALTADEEGGGPYNGVQWLLKNQRKLIDADFCLNEGGWGESVGGKRLSNDVQVSEKYVVNYRLEVRNKGGHSSLPVSDNAIYHLAGALDRLSRFSFPLKTNLVTQAYFAAMSTIEGGAIAADLANVANGDQGAMDRVARATTSWNATLRTTCVATQLEAGHAKNALPQLAAANVNCRVLPEDTLDDVTKTLTRVIADDLVIISVDGPVQTGPPSPMRDDVMTPIRTVTEAMWPGVRAVPMMVMGATDGLYLRAAGIPSYGVQGFFYDRDDIRFHGQDERLKVQSFYEGQSFLYELVKRLTSSRSPQPPPPATAGQQAAPPAAPPRPTPPTRDPLTPGYVTAKELPDGVVPPADADGNFIVGATHTAAPEMTVNEAVPQGAVYNFTMSSADSKMYPGVARDAGTFGTPDPNNPAKLVVTTSHPAPYTRRVAVYVPKQYVAGTTAPFIIGADGPDQSLFTALDNLIAQKRVPAMIAISIGNGSGDAQGSQRGLEYDTMSGRYAEFVESEVLPLVEKQYSVKLTKDPDGRATMGCSSGGSAALIMAWYHPELYHRVLTYSGTFVNQQWPPNPQTPGGAWELHKSLIPNSPVKPIRLWMQVGDRDLFNPNVMRDDMHDWVVANENMARVLAAKGYHYQFVFARNAGHCDRPTKLQTFPEALEWVWKGYAAR